MDPQRPDLLHAPTRDTQSIYTHLLADEGTFRHEGSKLVPVKYGGILIRGVYPPEYEAEWKRSSDLTPTSKRRVWKPERTTYSSHPDMDLELPVFQICRQIYDEASFVFYSKHRFYIENITALVPFLQDRPMRARGVIQKVSIPMPYGAQMDDDLVFISRYYQVNNSTFGRACFHLSTHPGLLPNLKQLDIRFWDFLDIYHGGETLESATVRMSMTRAKQLASVADPDIITVSFSDWHCSADTEDEREIKTVFEELPHRVHGKVQRQRDVFVMGGFNPWFDEKTAEDEHCDTSDDDCSDCSNCARQFDWEEHDRLTRECFSPPG